MSVDYWSKRWRRWTHVSGINTVNSHRCRQPSSDSSKLSSKSANGRCSQAHFQLGGPRWRRWCVFPSREHSRARYISRDSEGKDRAPGAQVAQNFIIAIKYGSRDGQENIMSGPGGSHKPIPPAQAPGRNGFKIILAIDTIPLDHWLDLRTTLKLLGLKKKVLLRLSTDCKIILFCSNKK